MKKGRTQAMRHRIRGFSLGAAVTLLLFLIASAGVFWVYTGVIAQERWPIRWLELNGAFQRVSAEQLRSSMTPLIDESFFTIDMQELHNAATRNSWVSSVRIQKAWPDTVPVTIEEDEPIAHWNRGDLISENGVSFSVPEADGIQGLPWLYGPDERLQEVLASWSEFSDMLAPSGLEISSLELDQRGAWAMDLSNGTHVQLGREYAQERLHRLLISWDSLMSDQEVPPRDVDLRYTNGFAVLWPQHQKTATGTDS